jgi:DNA modification methylase
MARRANSLDGKTWCRYSISIWDDIRKTREERALKHPAFFPVALARRIIERFLAPTGSVVLEPFCGLGSTVLAAHELGRVGVGFDINAEFITVPARRLGKCEDGCQLICADASDLLSHLKRGSVDLVVTSPPLLERPHAPAFRRPQAHSQLRRQPGGPGPA